MPCLSWKGDFLFRLSSLGRKVSTIVILMVYVLLKVSLDENSVHLITTEKNNVSPIQFALCGVLSFRIGIMHVLKSEN
jgi:hypothetical protein